MSNGVSSASKTSLGVALVAHDRMKPMLAEWVATHAEKLKAHRLYATGTTGRVLMERNAELNVTRFQSGPLGGDLQIGSRVVEGEIDVLIFFVDVLTPQPHDVDVKALIRIATLYGAPMACSAVTAEALIQAPWFADPSKLERPVNVDAEAYKNRDISAA